MRVLFLGDFPGVWGMRLLKGMKHFSDIEVLPVFRSQQGNATYEALGFRAPLARYLRPAFKNKLDKAFSSLFPTISLGVALKKMVKDFEPDLVYSLSSVDLSLVSLNVSRVPVIHDLSDFWNIFPLQVPGSSTLLRLQAHLKSALEKMREREVIRRAAGLSFNSAEVCEYAIDHFSIRGLTAIVPNAIPQAWFPTCRRAKVSGQDGQTHLAFAGHLNAKKLEPLLKVSSAGFHVHTYSYQDEGTAQLLEEAAQTDPFFHPHGSVPHTQLHEELTQYDAGMITWYDEAIEPIFDRSLPSKLHDYLAAGLPLLVRPFRSLKRFVAQYDCGAVIENWNDLPQAVEEAKSKVVRAEDFALEKHLGPLFNLFQRITS